jgi:hypothetical protein
MKPGDQIMVRPTHSLKFANRWGTVLQIDPEEGLPVLVKFSLSDVAYRFDYNELIARETLDSLRETPAFCHQCGVEITAHFVEICQACDLEQFEEDIRLWQK